MLFNTDVATKPIIKYLMLPFFSLFQPMQLVVTNNNL